MLYDMPSNHLGFPAAQSLDPPSPPNYVIIVRGPGTLLNVIHIKEKTVKIPPADVL